MANPKKDRGGPKKERKGSAPVDSDSDPSSEEEQEEVVPASVLKKQQRQRAAFFSLARQLITFLVAALVFSQQPFLVRPRGAGENALKLVPLKLAACGAGNWAAESPFMMRQPKLYEMLNATGAGLMAPFEWYRARTSVRAVDSEKTLSAALRKGGKAYARAVDADRSLRQIALQPSPNVPLLGAYACVLGALLAPLFGGAEYLVALGCGALVQGTRGAVCGASHQRVSETRLLRVHVGPVGSGMEPQPELYVTGALAVVAIMLHDSAKQRKEAPPARRKRR